MPYVFLMAGLALVITSLEGTYNALGQQLKKDFTGKDSYLKWALAITMVGALGYIPSVRPISNKLLWLILLVLFLANKGIWQNLTDAFNKGAISPKQNASTNTAPAAGATLGPWNTTTQSSNSTLSKGIGTLEKIAPFVTAVF